MSEITEYLDRARDTIRIALQNNATNQGQTRDNSPETRPEPAPETAPLQIQVSQEDRALSVFMQNFETIDVANQDYDTSKADGRVSRDDLEAAALRDDEVGEASRWILAQPDLVQFLDTGQNNIDYNDKVEEGRFHTTGGDGKISQDDIMAYVEKREVNRILQEVSGEIDVAHRGGEADGVLSRNDYEAFLRSGNATDEQYLAVTIALQDGAVDGEQGVANEFADYASEISKYAGYASIGVALVGLAVASGGTAVPAILTTAGTTLAVVGGGAAATEMTLGVITEDKEHIVGGAIGVVTSTVGAGSGGAFQSLGMKAAENGATVVVNSTGAVGGSVLSDSVAPNYGPEVSLDIDLDGD